VAEAEPRFRASAADWDRLYDGRDAEAHRVRSRLDAAVELIGPGPGDVLDIGVGSGRLLAVLAELGWTAHGVDPDPAMLELARTRVPHGAARLLVGRAEELPFPPASFGVVALLGVLEYTQLDAALAEAARVLRAGGRAVIGLHTCPAPATVWRETIVLPLARRVRRAGPRRRAVRLDDARRSLAQAGLTVERVVPVGAQLVPDPFDRLAPRLAYRAARWAERSPRLRRVFATQRLLVARKP
jgi:ubiquinone/menaquinone biosynthesis C-methylase UbiE